MTHVYRRVRDGDNWLYTVGYYYPHQYEEGLDWEWIPLEDTSREDEARALVNYLNGGDGKPFKYEK
jgi:hypothetical protein